MKRKITIIVIIILIITLFVGGAWLISRNNATKNNNPVPTFKEFLGIGVSTKPKSGATDSNTLSSDFTTSNTPTPTPTQNQKTITTNQYGIPVVTSIFTNSGFTPIWSNPTDLHVGGVSGSSNGGGTSNSGSGGSSGVGPTPLPPTPVVQTDCTTADVTINFTADEINKLNALKSRFFAVAETLNTDADVATELSNYSTFKAEVTKVNELYNYCVNNPVYVNAKPSNDQTNQPYGSTVLGENGDINYRVPTPFWHDLTKDNDAFVNQGINFKGIFSDPDFIFPERSVEHALRLNLW